MPKQNLKRQFRATLQPLMELFEHKKVALSHQDWEDFIILTKKSILANPEQFLGRDLPSHEEITETVDEIFQEYLGTEMSLV